jgi:CO/xanthine dehydrogenase Mo-binding subunit
MTPDAAAALERAGFSRRDFLKGAGVLVVSYSVAGCSKAPGTANNSPLATREGAPFAPIDPAQVDSWIAIAEDGSVTGYSGKCEFGQGFRTVQYQLVADELYVPLERVNLIICDTAFTPDQGTTSGSQSHPTEFGPSGLRQALATARVALIKMASEQLSVPVNQLSVENGEIFVIGDPSQRVTYGQLIGGQRFNLTVAPGARPKDPSQYTVLGTSVPRYEIPAKVTGQFEYVQSVRVPNTRHGKVVRPPRVGATVVAVDESVVQGLPGNVRVVQVSNFVGVVADKQYQALFAAQRPGLVTWSGGDVLPDQQGLYDWMRQQPSRDSYTVLSDDVDQRFGDAANIIAATYLTPFQMHGSVGASAAVADVQGSGPNGRATIWSATQGVYPQRDSVAVVLGIPQENVRVIFVEGSGCYGINGADTVSYDAALLSQADGNPVRVQLTRQDEMASGENYGPAYAIDLRAGLDDQGTIIVWDYNAWTLSKGNRPTAQAPGNIITGALAGFPTPPLVPGGGDPPTSYSNNGNSDSSYGAGIVGTRPPGGTGTIESERILTHTVASPFFTGPLRSPGRLQNTFANESFIDEVAAFVGADPVQYRLQYLSDQRLIDVLNAAAQAAGWDTRPSPKPGNGGTVVTGRGIACVLYEGNNGYSAMVAEVQVDLTTGKVTVTRIVASQDSGPVSNPDGLQNQMEGGALQGMSRCLREEVTWNNQMITSVNWMSYPVFHYGETLPVVETVLVNRLDKPQMGAGECTITLSAAAIANAIYDATGARVRQIPFTPARVLAAIQGLGASRR